MTRTTTGRFCSPASVHTLDPSTFLTYESSGTDLVQAFLVLLPQGLDRSFSPLLLWSFVFLVVLHPVLPLSPCPRPPPGDIVSVLTILC